jgi:hydrogenase maturation factor
MVTRRSTRARARQPQREAVFFASASRPRASTAHVQQAEREGIRNFALFCHITIIRP